MKIAFVGTGNLLESMLAGALRADVPRDWIMCSTRRAERAAELGKRYDVACTPSNTAAAQAAHLVIIGVSEGLEDVCREIAGDLHPGAVVAVATVPASLADVESWLPGVAVVRLMPSVNARVGEGVCGVARGTHVTDDQAELVTAFLAGQGEVQWLPEAGLDPLGSLAGSGPAYVAALARAMADGGVELGLTPEEALREAVVTLRGTAAMLESGLTPEEVAEHVGHPGGSTVRSLEHLRGAGALAAVTAAVSHSFEQPARRS